MIDHSNYSCDKCAREFSRHCKHCDHTADKPPTRFKPKKKTGCETPEFRSKVPMPPVKPPKPQTSGSNAVKPNPNYVPPASVKKSCPYELPCGWCAKWDKKCDKKIGCGHNGDVGQRGMIGICPDCGRSGCISWNPDTDVSSCSCGWNNDKPKRGLRAEGNVYDDNCQVPYGIIRKIIKEFVDYENAMNQLKEITKENNK